MLFRSVKVKGCSPQGPRVTWASHDASMDARKHVRPERVGFDAFLVCSARSRPTVYSSLSGCAQTTHSPPRRPLTPHHPDLTSANVSVVPHKEISRHVVGDALRNSLISVLVRPRGKCHVGMSRAPEVLLVERDFCTSGRGRLLQNEEVTLSIRMRRQVLLKRICPPHTQTQVQHRSRVS